MVNSGKIIIKSEDAKEKLEQQLRAQRNAQIQKRATEMKQGKLFNLFYWFLPRLCYVYYTIF